MAECFGEDKAKVLTALTSEDLANTFLDLAITEDEEFYLSAD